MEVEPMVLDGVEVFVVDITDCPLCDAEALSGNDQDGFYCSACENYLEITKVP